MDVKKLGSTLDVMSPEALLAKIVRHNKSLVSTDPASMIVTRLVLASGIEVDGCLIDIDKSKNAVVARDSSLAYVNVATLGLLEVLDPEAAAPLITNEPPPPPTAPGTAPVVPGTAPVVPGTAPVVPPGSPLRSELRTELAKLNTKMERRFRLTIEAEVLDDPSFGDAGKNQFVDFLTMLDHALTEIGSDDVGEITIGSLDQIMIAQAPGELAVKRSGDLMLIAVPFSKPFEATLSARLHTELQLNL